MLISFLLCARREWRASKLLTIRVLPRNIPCRLAIFEFSLFFLPRIIIRISASHPKRGRQADLFFRMQQASAAEHNLSIETARVLQSVDTLLLRSNCSNPEAGTQNAQSLPTDLSCLMVQRMAERHHAESQRQTKCAATNTDLNTCAVATQYGADCSWLPKYVPSAAQTEAADTHADICAAAASRSLRAVSAQTVPQRVVSVGTSPVDLSTRATNTEVTGDVVELNTFTAAILRHVATWCDVLWRNCAEKMSILQRRLDGTCCVTLPKLHQRLLRQESRRRAHIDDLCEVNRDLAALQARYDALLDSSRECDEQLRTSRRLYEESSRQCEVLHTENTKLLTQLECLQSSLLLQGTKVRSRVSKARRHGSDSDEHSTFSESSDRAACRHRRKSASDPEEIAPAKRQGGRPPLGLRDRQDDKAPRDQTRSVNVSPTPLRLAPDDSAASHRRQQMLLLYHECAEVLDDDGDDR